MAKLSSLSIVLPCHNEELVIHETWLFLNDLVKKWEGKIISGHEFVMVNNGSTDKTLEKMLEIAGKDPSVMVVDLRRNYGYQGSITAGMFAATKDMVVTIDSDLQDDPLKIEEMVQKYDEGYEMVLGVRSNRQSDSFFKRWTAAAYYYVLKKLNVESVAHHGDFRLLSRHLIEDLKKFPERNRYLRGMVLQLESKYALVNYDRRKRQLGETKFRLRQLVSLAIDGISSFTAAPLRIITFFGFLAFLFSGITIFYILYVKYVQGVNVPGWAFICVSLAFFGGVQGLSVGMAGEYIAKSYLEAKQRPLFLVRTIYANGVAQARNRQP